MEKSTVRKTWPTELVWLSRLGDAPIGYTIRVAERGKCEAIWLSRSWKTKATKEIFKHFMCKYVHFSDILCRCKNRFISACLTNHAASESINVQFEVMFTQVIAPV